MNPDVAPQHRRRLDAAVVIVLTAAALLVRASGLAPSSLWLDDAWVALVHRVGSLSDVWRMGLTAPGFAVLLKAWLAGSGLSSLNAQALPLAAGVLLPGGTYLVARRLHLRATAAAAAGVVLVLAPAHAVYSTRVKQFTLDALLVLTLVWLATRAAERPAHGVRWRVLAAVATVATVVSTAVVPAAAAIAVGALVPVLRRRWRDGVRDPAALAGVGPVGWVGSYLAFAVLWGGWMAAGRVSVRLHEYWTGFYIESWSDLPRTATALVAGLLGEDHGAVVAAVVAAWLVGALLALRREPRDAALLWGPPAAAMTLAALGAAPIGTGRTELYLYPVLALGLAWTVHHVGARLPHAGARDGVALGALLAIVAVALPVVEVTYPEEDLRPLVAAVEEALAPTDQILVSPSAAYATALYGPWMVGIRRNQTPLGFAPRFTERVAVIRVSGDVSNIQQRYGDLPAGARVWMLSAHTVEARMEGARAALRELGFRSVGRRSRPGADLEVWERSGS